MDDTPHVKTKDRRLLVENLVAFGMNELYIAKQLDLPVAKLKELYADELRDGIQAATHKVANRLFTIATTAEPKYAVPAAQFWLKTRAGWKEEPKQVELTGKGGKDLVFANRAEFLNEIAEKFGREEGKAVN